MKSVINKVVYLNYNIAAKILSFLGPTKKWRDAGKLMCDPEISVAIEDAIENYGLYWADKNNPNFTKWVSKYYSLFSRKQSEKRNEQKRCKVCKSK